ncbi:MAG: hypothetical protein ACXW4Z_13000, partial [Candidatus Binatia bacterium]
ELSAKLSWNDDTPTVLQNRYCRKKIPVDEVPFVGGPFARSPPQANFTAFGCWRRSSILGHSKTMSGATSGSAIEWLDPTARNSKRLPVQAK